MKTFLAALILFGAAVASAQAPDPRDSVIIERKSTGPTAGPCQSAVLKVRVWITNKDSLSAIQLPIVTIEQVRTANATLSRAADCNPARTFDDVYNVLLPAGQLPNRTADFSRYNSTPPDTFSAMLAGDLSDDLTKVPPNSIRSPLLDIKFDSVSGSAPFGWLVLLSTGIDAGDDIRFVTAQGVPLKVNFFAGLIEVRPTPMDSFPPPPTPIPDSVIIESKIVAPQNSPCGSAPLRVKVWITNNDSLANISLPLGTRSVSDSAYATLSRPASCGARTLFSYVFNFLYPPGPGGGQRLPTRSYNARYNSNSPDTFYIAATLDDPANDDGKMPPNPSRALLGEIKFDSVNPNLGQFEIDTTAKPTGFHLNAYFFTRLDGTAIQVNFLKSTITVAPKGDLNLDFALTPADVVLMLNCIFRGTPPPAGVGSCDLNCDGMTTTADFVLSLNATFLGDPFPC